MAFTDTGRLFGDAATQQAFRNVHNTVFSITRLIGRRFSDPGVQETIKRWPYKVICGPDDRPQVVMRFKGEKKAFDPVEILAMMLADIREALETRMGKKVKDAVLTVPASFNSSQRQAVKDAAAVAGFHVTRLISGPTAAAITHGLERKGTISQYTVLVFGLGGGTLDVSLVAIEGDIYEVLATAADTNLGGEDFDRLVDHCVAVFKTTHNKDPRIVARAMVRLRVACERAKRALSVSPESSIELDSLCDGIDFHATITRTLFEELCVDLIDKIMQPVHQVLSDAKVMRTKVNDLVLVGGSTRIPKVAQVLKEFFNGAVNLFNSPRPEENPVHGATILAAMLTKELSAIKSLDEFMVLDVVPLSLGVEIDSKNLTVMIPRNTTIPTKKTRTFSTSEDNQSVMRIQVFEGESKEISGNHALGQLIVVNIPPKPRGESEIEVTLDVDANRALRLSVVDKSTGKKQNIVIDSGRLSSYA